MARGRLGFGRGCGANRYPPPDLTTMTINSFLKIAGRIVFLALAFIILLFIGAALPIPGNYKIFAVLSGSMAPAISTGSLVLVVPFDDYKTGEVVTFGKSGNNQIPTTHRVVAVRVNGGQTFYATKGDANNARDFNEVAKAEVLGKVVVAAPLAGYAVSVLKSPAGFLMLVVLPAVWAIVSEGAKIGRELRRKKNPPA
jgi:signal peptidase I